MTARFHSWVFAALVAASLPFSGESAVAQSKVTAANLSDEHVQKAIATLAESLHARKHPQRFWELARVPANESSRQGGGYTALAALALLNAGQSYQDPRLRDAVDYLAALNMEGTYAVTMRASLWAKLPQRFHENLAADARWLLEGFSEPNGGWDYVKNPTAKYHDNSIRQFGALALWEAAKRDVKVPRPVWERLERAYLNMQLSDGGWNYKGEGAATGSMTTAGLATLFITQDLLHAAESVKLGASSTSSPHEKAIEMGLTWMDKNFSPTANPGKNTHFFYYLYGIERVGLASGYKRFGGRDWFREGAAELIDRLCAWDAASQTFSLRSAAASPSKTDEISFALLFLSRGRVPVAFNKLQFSGAWNNRPRDVANLTHWIGENSESELSWQIVNLESEPNSWLDAPLLYLASHEPLPWMKGHTIDAKAYARQVKQFIDQRGAGTLEVDANPPAPPSIAELKKLKRYLELGGTILAVNEGGSKAFVDSIERAGLLMFPQYDWRNLPEDHWAYTAHETVNGRRPPLRGLSNGVRELIILCTAGELPAAFQTSDTRQIADFQTAANIYFYASELNRPRPRLAQHAVAVNESSSVKMDITIVRALHEGNWKPEPAALEIFAAQQASRGMNIRLVDHPLAKIHEIDPKPALVIVSGIEAHHFTPEQIAAIKSCISEDGVILFETIGGRGEFAASAEIMMEQAFGKSIESVLRTSLITGQDLADAVDLTQVEYRPFSMQAFGTRETAPRLRGMTIDEARGPQLLFSREDISHALLDQPCWGISGYSPHSARALMNNILRFASKSHASQ